MSDGVSDPRVQLPNEQDCVAFLREQRWPDRVTCPHCKSKATIKKGTTRNDVQRHRCQICDRIFTVLTGTIFSGHQLNLSEMFYMIKKMDEKQMTQLSWELDRTYKTVLNFVREAEYRLETSELELAEVRKSNIRVFQIE